MTNKSEDLLSLISGTESNINEVASQIVGKTQKFLKVIEENPVKWKDFNNHLEEHKDHKK